MSPFASLLGSKENFDGNFMLIGVSHLFDGIENHLKHQSIERF